MTVCVDFNFVHMCSYDDFPSDLLLCLQFCVCLSVTSSEKVDKAQRYSDFTLLSVPYPGLDLAFALNFMLVLISFKGTSFVLFFLFSGSNCYIVL